MAKQKPNSRIIHWNGISIEVEWEGEREYPEITGIQLVTATDLLEFADYTIGCKSVMDEIELLLQEELAENEIDPDYLRDLRQDR